MFDRHVFCFLTHGYLFSLVQGHDGGINPACNHDGDCNFGVWRASRSQNLIRYTHLSRIIIPLQTLASCLTVSCSTLNPQMSGFPSTRPWWRLTFMLAVPPGVDIFTQYKWLTRLTSLMHTLSTVFDHLGSYFVSRTYGFPSLWSFCQQQMQHTIMMTVPLSNSLGQLCRVLRFVSDCCMANFLNSKFLTTKLTSYTVSDSHWMLPLVSFTPLKCSRRLAWPSCRGLYPFSNVQVALHLSLYSPFTSL